MAPKAQYISPHDEAVSIVERLALSSLGGTLKATADCNQCDESLVIDLMDGASEVIREKSVDTVRPDISLLDQNGRPVRFIEVVDSHAPVDKVHEYALQHSVEIVEIHLRAKREFAGSRINKALDKSLTVKARLQELSDGRIVIDAHNLLCQRPKCGECGVPLPLRTITVSITDCWKCGQNVNVAVGEIDGKALEQDNFTLEEVEFARKNGVILERRFSATVGGKYLANVCTKCDQIQGNWFLYMDPFHDRFMLHKAERKVYGPCNPCLTLYCHTHGEFMDFKDTKQCPVCIEEAERVMCPNKADRECFYPLRCEKDGCYFVNREQEMQEQMKLAEQQQKINKELLTLDMLDQQALSEQESREWKEFQKWVRERQQEGR